ncbi:hypothetical protein JCM10213_001719 [Rhodosporidiobolus nylandii]
MIREAVGEGLKLDFSELRLDPAFSPWFHPSGQFYPLSTPADRAAQNEYVTSVPSAAGSDCPAHRDAVTRLYQASKPSPRATDDANATMGDPFSFKVSVKASTPGRVSTLKTLGLVSTLKALAVVLGHRILKRTPLPRVVYDEGTGKPKKKFLPNRQKGRRLSPKPLFHFSVEERAKGYEPAATTQNGHKIADMQWED